MWLATGKTYSDLVNNNNNFITIADTGNIAYSGVNGLVGDVNYIYQICKYEITNNEYCLFLNSVNPFGSDSINLYSFVALGGIFKKSSSVAGDWYKVKENMGNKPVNYITINAIYRYCNWLHNGALKYKTTTEGFNSTNYGAYNIGTSTSNTIIPPFHSARFRIPTPSEWFKAAYYNASGSNYQLYATQASGYAPTPVLATSDGDGRYVIYNIVSASEYDILRAKINNDNLILNNNFSNLEIDVLHTNKSVNDTIDNRVSTFQFDTLYNSNFSIQYNYLFLQDVLMNDTKLLYNDINSSTYDILLNLNNNYILSNDFDYFTTDILYSQKNILTELSSSSTDIIFSNKQQYDNINSLYQVDVLTINTKKSLYHDSLKYDVFFNKKT